MADLLRDARPVEDAFLESARVKLVHGSFQGPRIIE
jgi:hypothetical protein